MEQVCSPMGAAISPSRRVWTVTSDPARGRQELVNDFSRFRPIHAGRV
jgi:hypothetical protein